MDITTTDALRAAAAQWPPAMTLYVDAGGKQMVRAEITVVNGSMVVKLHETATAAETLADVMAEANDGIPMIPRTGGGGTAPKKKGKAV